jgi:alkylation response protein AidB-like acyl-CoA dehydrogenase
MDLDPTEVQRQLQETIGRFARDRFPIQVVRAWGAPDGFTREHWRALAELGTFAITVPEQRGGVGMPTVDEVLVHETLGAALTPGPLVAASLAARLADQVAGDIAGRVIDGSVVPAVVDTTRPNPNVAEHLRDADTLLVLDRDDVRVVDASDVETRDAVHPTDPTTPVLLITRVPDGRVVGGPEDAAQLRLLGSLLSSAQLVGNSEASTALAVEYAKQREQFGRPIGSFQGVKHLLADSYVRTEVARSAVWAAGVLVDEPDAGDLRRAVAGARVLAARAGLENAKTCVHVHGGMGFTWEVDAHLFLKRAMVLETAFDSTDDAAELVASTLRR